MCRNEGLQKNITHDFLLDHLEIAKIAPPKSSFFVKIIHIHV